MIFDRMCSFWEAGDTITITANATNNSRIIDLRLNGGLEDQIKVFIINKAGTNTSTMRTKLQTSANGTSNWTDIGGEQAPSGNILYKGVLPAGCKRFVRAVCGIGATAPSAAVSIKGGFVDEYDVNAVNRLQTFSTVTGKMEDVASTTVVTMK